MTPTIGISLFPLVSMRKLESLLGYSRIDLWKIANKAGTYYRSFDQRPKGSNKKFRHIDNPTGDVRELQKRIQKNILRKFVYPETMLGGVQKGSILENARRHADQKQVFAIDLRNCFPSTRHTTVLKTYIEKLGCSGEISGLLTKLTTYQTRLPQGAPTSSLLANLTLLNVHDDIKTITDELSLNLTFYVDDIVISGKDITGAIEPVIKAVQKNGLSISCKKKKLMNAWELQKVTGLVVNKEVNIAREYVESLRKDIINAAKIGYFTENEDRSFQGRINYISAINERTGQKVERFYEGFAVEIKGEKKIDRFEYQNCKCAKKHKVKRIKKAP